RKDAHKEVLDAVQRAVAAVPELRFPIDVTFPGENEPDQVDAWISAYAEPFYIRSQGLDVEAEGAELLAAVLGDVLRAPRRHPHPVDAEVRHHAGERLPGPVPHHVG